MTYIQVIASWHNFFMDHDYIKLNKLFMFNVKSLNLYKKKCFLLLNLNNLYYFESFDLFF